MVETVREFVTRSWRLINPSNPTQPLHGPDFTDGVYYLNDLMSSYAATGLLLTIAKTVDVPVLQGQSNVFVGPPDFVPTPEIPLGRLANYENSWVLLNGVTYPLIYISRDEFLQSFKYEPLQGLPRMLIRYPDTEVVQLQIYPAPSQQYQFFLRGKFELAAFDKDADMSRLPKYYSRYLKFALARDLAMYKGRAAAWTDKLEKMLKDAEDIMVNTSEVNVAITGAKASLLNGAYRVQAGI